MSFRKWPSSKQEFRIKLMSGNNVVCVESPDYESEIFMPKIVNGRITFQNIIPNRRCCRYAASEYTKKRLQQLTDIENVDLKKVERAHRHIAPTFADTWHMTTTQDLSARPLTPMSFSTPKGTEASSQSSHFAATPPKARCSVPTPYQVLKDAMVQIPPGIKVIRLYRNRTAGSPKRAGRVVGIHSNNCAFSPVIATNGGTTPVQSNVSSFNFPETPKRSSARKGSRIAVKHGTFPKQPPTQIPASKWLKCLTPKRTYKHHTARGQRKQAKRHQISTTARFASSKVIPTYMANPTQGPKGTHTVRVRKRKLIVDPTIKISPRAFKLQQRQNEDGAIEMIDTRKLPKTRKLYDNCKNSAFDLLTKSNRAKIMSTKLDEQFRRGCLNKASSTYTKFKILSRIPPIEDDMNLREFSY